MRHPRPRSPAPPASPSCGPVRLIAVDGHAGSGKSTFAGRLAAAWAVRRCCTSTTSPVTTSCSAGPRDCSPR
ncbi:NACHT domain-containing protein [Streptomyces violaceoruber]